MIGYVTLGVNDFQKACAFYDELFLTIGIKRLWTHGNMAAWAKSRTDAALCITSPFNKEAASSGNGTMVALKVENKEQVHSIYQKVIELGGTDEGKPGPRGEHGFYGAYFRDLDGNKLNAYFVEK